MRTNAAVRAAAFGAGSARPGLMPWIGILPEQEHIADAYRSARRLRQNLHPQITSSTKPRVMRHELVAFARGSIAASRNTVHEWHRSFSASCLCGTALNASAQAVMFPASQSSRAASNCPRFTRRRRNALARVSVMAETGTLPAMPQAQRRTTSTSSMMINVMPEFMGFSVESSTVQPSKHFAPPCF